MNKEAYVSFKTAKLLKGKGFDWPCICYYDDNGIMHEALDYVRQNDGEDDDNDECLCPTQQMAMRWVRTHGINIEPITCPKCYTWRVLKRYKATNGLYGIKIVDTGLQGSFDEYEDAVEAALEYCLTELI